MEKDLKQCFNKILVELYNLRNDVDLIKRKLGIDDKNADVPPVIREITLKSLEYGNEFIVDEELNLNNEFNLTKDDYKAIGKVLEKAEGMTDCNLEKFIDLVNKDREPAKRIPESKLKEAFSVYKDRGQFEDFIDSLK